MSRGLINCSQGQNKLENTDTTPACSKALCQTLNRLTIYVNSVDFPGHTSKVRFNACVTSEAK